MPYFVVEPSYEDLEHYGVLGMKWGVRRYQNKDGSLTSEGKKHYSESGDSESPKNGGLSEGQKKALKYAAIGLGVAAMAGVGYLAYQRYGQKYTDITLKSGHILQTLSTEADRISNGESFYAAINEHDKTLYKGLFGEVKLGSAQRSTGSFRKKSIRSWLKK